MTISTTSSETSYPCDGSTTVYPVTFPFFEDSDLAVVVVDSLGNESTLTLGTDYTVTGGGGFAGSVTVSSAYASGYTLYIARATPYTQPTSFRNQGRFLASVHENAFDRMSMQIQQLYGLIGPWNGNGRVMRQSLTGDSWAGQRLPIRSIADPTLPQDAATKHSSQAYADAIRDYLEVAISELPASIGYFLQTGTGAIRRTLQDKAREIPSVEDFGAVGDGATDDYEAFYKALNSGLFAIRMTRAEYYLSEGIVVPSGVMLYGDGVTVANQQTLDSCGSRIIFNDDVETCVTLGGATNSPCTVRNFSIDRVGGTSSNIPTGSIGIYLDSVKGGVAEDISVASQAIAYSIYGGISIFANRLSSTNITDAHLVIDETPEVRFTSCRFGGNNDQSCNDYVRITGGSAGNTAGGPNTISFIGCHFNQGSGTVTNWFNFSDQLSDSVSDTGLIVIDSCYVESNTYGFSNDSSWTTIRRVFISNTESNATGTFFNIVSGTTLQDWYISNFRHAGDITTTSGMSLSHLHISNSSISNATTFSAASGSNLTVSNCTFYSTVNVANITWGNCRFSNITDGGFTNAAYTWGAAKYTGVSLVGVGGWGNLFQGASYLNAYGSSAGIYMSYGSTTQYMFKLQSDGNAVFYGSDGNAVASFGGPSNVIEFSRGISSAIVPSVDDDYSIGSATYRWENIYAASSTISTSDAREKTEVVALTSAELSAAKALASKIGTYKWLASIQAKGEGDARTHIGMTVQDAIAVMDSYGLDPMAYGFICYDEWDAIEEVTQTVEVESSSDESSEESSEEVIVITPARAAGNRYSFRVDELLLFIARGFDARLASLESATGVEESSESSSS